MAAWTTALLTPVTFDRFRDDTHDFSYLFMKYKANILDQLSSNPYGSQLKLNWRRAYVVQGWSNSLEKSWQTDNSRQLLNHSDFCSSPWNKKSHWSMERRETFILLSSGLRKGTDTWGKAVAVPPIGITCKKKDASDTLGLCWLMLRERQPMHLTRNTAVWVQSSRGKEWASNRQKTSLVIVIWLSAFTTLVLFH